MEKRLGPRVFDYSDYVAFFQDCLSFRRKEASGSWTLNAWAKRLNLRSASTLTMILRGQRNPSQELVSKLARSLNLPKQEGEYLQSLVELKRHSGNATVRVSLMERLAAKHPAGEFQLLDPDVYALISNWHHYAIREMVNLVDFREDPRWISKRLAGAITPREVRDSIKLLIALNLLARNEGGNLVCAPGWVDTCNDVADSGLKSYHSQILNRAKEALYEVHPTQREITGVTFATTQDRMEEAKELIRDFREKFMSLVETSSGDQVVHLEIAYFPLTKPTSREQTDAVH